MKHDSYTREILELGRRLARTAGLPATFKVAFLLSYSREYCIKNNSRLADVEKLLHQFDSGQVMDGYLGQSLACESHDSSPLASSILSPALVITGKDDLITPPAAAEKLAAALPNAQLVLLPRGGHGVWREFPADVNPIVRDFLAHHSAS